LLLSAWVFSSGGEEEGSEIISPRSVSLPRNRLAIVLEDALMSNAKRVIDYMVAEPVRAYLWQPISAIRQTMLSNAFSYLPVFVSDVSDKNANPPWRWVSDFKVARYLRSQDRDKSLATTLGEAFSTDQLDAAELVPPDCSVAEALDKSKGYPLLVVRDGHEYKEDGLLGIVTPFDLL
jgi:hypothetical protein